NNPVPGILESGKAERGARKAVRTEVAWVDPQKPEGEAIARAAQMLRRGELVAFPTETVYGLGANALDAAAVARIYAVKGRPASNPLIVHVAEAGAAREIVMAWPEAAARLAARFWPGPLTLVLPKRDVIPEIVTAGGPTVAVRVPAHPVARALLIAAAVPVAAPSANRSLRLSPTQAAHVLRSLRGRIPLILDGGPATGGLESTVLDLTASPPRLLRPGLVTPADIEAVIGPIGRGAKPAEDRPLPSPGMMARHYAPRAPLEIQTGAAASDRVRALLAQGEAVGWLTFTDSDLEPPGLTVLVMPAEPEAYAARLYAALHALDAAGVTRIVVDLPPEDENWLAARDRLRRATAIEGPNGA
ncbi:MAG TPA: L-threonylcarbamoyladenylate synthase, partial [Chthonomonadaceae bacterium]|nr:L-threonylcarbamoyladenylate synthase [Chthonomonadaceae bacterium]